MKKLVYSLMVLSLAACSGGQAGKDGNSCSVVTNADGTATIKCTDGSNFDIVNGKDGDAGSDGKDGQDGKSCYLTENSDGSAAVVCPYDGSSYIVRGTTDNYANYCKEGYYGPNCVDCSKNGKNSYFGREECTFTDSRDGQIYNVVKIGDQIWMAENLKTTTDRSGNPVNCYANTEKDPDFVKNFGCLYVWNELVQKVNGQDNNVNNICPSGWHLPSKADFDELLTYVDNNKSSSSTSFLSLIANSAAWKDYSNQGLDEFGFGALPAGNYNSGYYLNFGLCGIFWSSEESYDSSAYYLFLGNGSAYVYSNYKTIGYSVRCIKDSN